MQRSVTSVTLRTRRSCTVTTRRSSRRPRRLPSFTTERILQSRNGPGDRAFFFEPVGMSEAEPVIVATEVTKRYGRSIALDAVSLEVSRGEVFCLLGPNGSGKTTFFRMLTGFLLPSGGSLRVAGHDVVNEPMAARRRIGYVPESVPMYRHMRVGEF